MDSPKTAGRMRNLIGRHRQGVGVYVITAVIVLAAAASAYHSLSVKSNAAIESLAVARGADVLFAFVPRVPPYLVARLFLVEAAQFQAGAEAGLTPPVLGIEREQPRVELREAPIAHRASALGGENLHGAFR